MKKAGLGRGLGALIPADVTAATTGGAEDTTDRVSTALREIPVAAIHPNPHQPRRQFDEEQLLSLAASIEAVGVLQPVIVRPVDDHRFELVAGERRWRAARRAGLASIPAIVRDIDDVASVEQALVENLHRQDLNPLEEAGAYQQLIEDFGMTHDEVATRVGKSRSAVSNTLRLLQLPAPVQALVIHGQLSAGHARALLGTPDRAEQERLARRCVEENWTVRAIEDAVRALARPREPEVPVSGGAQSAPRESTRAGGSSAARPAGLLELEEVLSEHLLTRVRVDGGPARGRIVIEFASLDDLERLYRTIVGMDEAPT